jgi:hypothetical protein
MNCQQATELIEKHFDQKDVMTDGALRDHLKECPDCHHIYQAYESLGRVTDTVRKNKPELDDPAGLTDDIMQALEEVSKEENLSKKINGKFFLDRVAFKRSLAAAAVLLFAVFSFEQYVVLDKVNRLEQQIQLTGKSNAAWERQTVIKYNRLRENNKVWINSISRIQKKLSAIDRNVIPAKANQIITIN